MKARRYFVLIIVTQTLILCVMSYIRFIDIDEGYYLYASTLVTQGKIPYLDFFYTQMPLLPYLYGSWMKITGFSWFSARLLSVAISLLTTVLLFVYIRRKSRNDKVALIAALLFIFNGQVISWFVTVKTYAVTTFLSLAAFMLLTSEKRRNIFAAGLCLGLATNIRLTCLPLIIVSAVWVIALRNKPGIANACKDFLALVAGVFLVSLYTIYLASKNPAAFCFDILTYHRLSYPQTATLSLYTVFVKLRVIFLALSKIQSFLLFIAAMGTAVLLRIAHARKKLLSVYRNELLAFLFLGTIFFSSVAIFRPSEQYFVTCVIFLIIASRPFIEEIIQGQIAVLRLLSAVLLALYIALCLPSTGTLGGLSGIAGEAWHWHETEKIARKIKETTNPNDRILSSWSGYLFLSGRSSIPGMENEFGHFLVSESLSAEMAQRYRIATDDDLRAAIRAREPKVVIWGWPIPDDSEKTHIEELLREYYPTNERIGPITFYLREK